MGLALERLAAEACGSGAAGTAWACAGTAGTCAGMARTCAGTAGACNGMAGTCAGTPTVARADRSAPADADGTALAGPASVDAAGPSAAPGCADAGSGCPTAAVIPGAAAFPEGCGVLRAMAGAWPAATALLEDGSFRDGTRDAGKATARAGETAALAAGAAAASVTGAGFAGHVWRGASALALLRAGRQEAAVADDGACAAGCGAAASAWAAGRSALVSAGGAACTAGAADLARVASARAGAGWPDAGTASTAASVRTGVRPPPGRGMTSPASGVVGLGLGKVGLPARADVVAAGTAAWTSAGMAPASAA